MQKKRKDNEMKLIITLVILVIGVIFTILSLKEGEYKVALFSVIATVALNIFSNFMHGDIELLFSKKDETSTTMSVDETSDDNEDNYKYESCGHRT